MTGMTRQQSQRLASWSDHTDGSARVRAGDHGDRLPDLAGHRRDFVGVSDPAAAQRHEGRRHHARDSGDADPYHGHGPGVDAVLDCHGHLSGGVRRRQSPDTHDPHGHRQPGRHPLHRLRTVRSGRVRPGSGLWHIDPGRLADIGHHDHAGGDQHRRGGHQLRAAAVPHRQLESGRQQVADDLEPGAAARHARHHHWHDSGAEPRGRRDSPDSVHRGGVLSSQRCRRRSSTRLWSCPITCT